MHGLTHYDALQKFKVTYFPSRTISVLTHNVRVNSTYSFRYLFFLTGQKGSSDAYG